MRRDVYVRTANPDELADVLGVLDSGALETDADRVRAAIDSGDVLAAVTESPGSAGDTTGETLVGALVLEDQEIVSVAVRRRRRGQGIGTALVSAAADRRSALVAEFDERLKPFYDALGFRVEPTGDERYRGRFDDER